MSRDPQPDTLVLGLTLLALWVGWAYLAYSYVQTSGPLDRIVHAGGLPLAFAVGWLVISLALTFFGIYYSIKGLRARLGAPGV